MSEQQFRENIEKQLFEAIQVHRDKYLAGDCSRDEYAAVLKAFNDFVIRGILPTTGAKKAQAGSA